LQQHRWFSLEEPQWWLLAAGAIRLGRFLERRAAQDRGRRAQRASIS